MSYYLSNAGMRISKRATRKFGNWVGKRVPLIPSDLVLKHKLMAEHPFTFMRAKE